MTPERNLFQGAASETEPPEATFDLIGEHVERMTYLLLDGDLYMLPTDLPTTRRDNRAPRRGEPPTPGPDLPPGQ